MSDQTGRDGLVIEGLLIRVTSSMYPIYRVGECREDGTEHQGGRIVMQEHADYLLFTAFVGNRQRCRHRVELSPLNAKFPFITAVKMYYMLHQFKRAIAGCERDLREMLPRTQQASL